MLKNKDFKTIYCSAGNQFYQRKVVPQVNLVIPPVVSRLISAQELRAVAIKHLVELSVEHEFFCHFFSKRKTCHGGQLQLAVKVPEYLGYMVCRNGNAKICLHIDHRFISLSRCLSPTYLTKANH